MLLLLLYWLFLLDSGHVVDSNLRGVSQTQQLPLNSSRYERSVNTFYQIRYCLPKEPCKRQFRMEFLCRCTNQMNCGSPGLYYNAYCQVEVMGVIWAQPKIIEYRGHIIVLSSHSPPSFLQDRYSSIQQGRSKRKKKRG